MIKHEFDYTSWAAQSVFWQMGNIGSEVGRAFNGRRNSNEKRAMSAFYRGLDLINATIQAWVSRGKDPYELLIAREQFAKSMLTDEIDETLEQYFMNFAIAARLHK